MRVAASVTLSPEERARLEERTKGAQNCSRSVRARIVLSAAAGRENREIASAEGVSRMTVARWRDRFALRRLPGLDDRPRPALARVKVSEATVRAIVRAASGRRRGGWGGWSTRTLAREVGVSHMTVRRIWEMYGLRPARHGTWPPRPDPVAPLAPQDVVGLFLHPPDAALATLLGPRVPGAFGRKGTGPASGPPTNLPEPGFAPTGSGLGVGASPVPASGPRPRSRELLSFLGAVERSAGRMPPLRILLTGPAALEPSWIERWKVRHPSAEVVPYLEWSTWRAQSLDALRQLGRGAPARGFRGGRAEAARSLGLFLREYDEANDPFEWVAPAAALRSGDASLRLRYDLSVTGHSAFKSPFEVPTSMSPQRSTDDQLRRVARNVLRHCLRVKKGERVTIDTWSTTLPDANAFVLETLALGAQPLLIYQDEATYWAATTGTSPENLGRLGEHRRAAMERTDALVTFFGPSDRERFHALPAPISARLCDYDDALYRAAARAGVRAVQLAIGRVSASSARMYGVDLPSWRDEMVEGALVDPDELKRRASPLMGRLATGRELRITHANGTDLRLRLARSKPQLSDGRAGAVRRGGQWSLITVPAGVVLAPVSTHFAEGNFRSNVRSAVGLCDTVGEIDGASWTFANGRLTGYEYAEGSELFARSYGRAGPGRELPAYVSVGLNDALDISPLLEDQGTGTITMHLGRNRHVGGSNAVGWWAWLFLRGGDLRVDGTRVVRGGKLLA